MEDSYQQGNGSPTFYALLQRMSEIHNKKSYDYASNDNPYANYHFAGMISKLFDNPNDAGFVSRIGEKLYRLANLENSNKIPLNENIEDTEIDICTIMVLWMSSRKDARNKRNELVGQIKVKMDQVVNKPVDNIFDNLQHRCVICNSAFMDMHLYCKHAIDMHSATYDPREGSLQFVDTNKTKEVLPSLKFLLGTYQLVDKDIPF